MPHVSRLCLRVHFITFELFVVKKVACAESAKRENNSLSACPSQFSAAAALFSSEESLEIQNRAMKRFPLLLPSNPFRNTISLGLDLRLISLSL